MKRLLAGLSVAVLLIFLFEGMQIAQAQQMIISIKPDGSIDPYIEGLQREGDTYLLTADLNCSLNIQKGNIVLEGANRTLHGPGSSQNFIGITLMASNVTVKSFYISGWKAGVYGAFNNNTITANVFTDNYQAIAIYANNYVVSKNKISGCTSVGILIDSGALEPRGDNNLVYQNQIVNNNWAIDILNSNGTTIKENNVTDNAVILTLGALEGNISLVGNHELYLNNFIDNNRTLHIPFGGPTVAGFVPISPAGNWDNGTVGNYWSDYLLKYSNASEIDHSGIADTAYLIQHSTTWSRTYANGTYLEGTAVFGIAADNYPLMAPYEASSRPTGGLPSPSESTSSTPTPSPSQTPSQKPSILPTRTPAPSEPQASQSTQNSSPTPSIPELPQLTVSIIGAVAVLAAVITFLARRKRVRT